MLPGSIILPRVDHAVRGLLREIGLIAVLARRLGEAANVIGIQPQDHLILGRGRPMGLPPGPRRVLTPCSPFGGRDGDLASSPPARPVL